MEKKNKKNEEKKVIFSFINFAKLIIKRQINKENGTNILIYGSRRTGKTTLGFKILIAYLFLKRIMYKRGESKWMIPKQWSKLFKDYFSGSAGEMTKKIKDNPEGSFSFVDEGIDIFNWHHMMKTEQVELTEVILKAGKKKMLNIIIVPSWDLLTKDMKANCDYLFILTSEPDKRGNKAFYFTNYKNPRLREKNPFGMTTIDKAIGKYKNLANNKQFERFLIRQECCKGICRFGKISDKLYNLYDILVKEPLIMGGKDKLRTIPYAKYKKLEYAFNTLLNNLFNRDNKSYAQIHRLLIDKWGSGLASQNTIRYHIDKMMAMEKRPVIAKDENEIIEVKKEDDFEDVDTDSEKSD